MIRPDFLTNAQIYFSPYELKFKNKFKPPLVGALLLFEFDSYLQGYSDFLPWPQWGEQNLFQQIESCSLKKFSSRFLISAHNAYEDACFRSQKRNPFLGLTLPPSHFFIEDILSFQAEDIFENYKYVKVKLNNSLLEEQLKQIKKWSLKFSSVQWRLDTQGQNLKIPQEFLLAMENRIDFIEDSQNRNLNLWGAEDWIKNTRFLTKVAKPSRDFVQHLTKGIACARWKRLIFTHSFDHPLGQVITAFRASQFYKNHPSFFETCGLQCFSLQENEYQIPFSSTPFFKHPQGFGFGWEEELKREKWKKII